MKFIISGKNITVSQGLKTAVEDKLGKLERYFTPDTEVVVTLSVEKERQKIEVTIPMKGNIIQNKQQRGWDYEIYYQRKKHHSISGTQNSR